MNVSKHRIFVTVAFVGAAFVFSTNVVAAKKESNKIEACVAKWRDAYRKEEAKRTDDPDMISIAQIEEWEEWCKKGKEPAKNEPVLPRF